MPSSCAVRTGGANRPGRPPVPPHAGGSRHAWWTGPTVTDVDVAVVGAGPNGLAAAVTLARAGLRVLVVERGDTIGGGARTAEVPLPGFRHDLGSAVHPMAVASPFFRRFRLAERIRLVTPPLSLPQSPRGVLRASPRRRARGPGLARPRAHGRRPRPRRARVAPLLRPPRRTCQRG